MSKELDDIIIARIQIDYVLFSTLSSSRCICFAAIVVALNVPLTFFDRRGWWRGGARVGRSGRRGGCALLRDLDMSLTTLDIGDLHVGKVKERAVEGSRGSFTIRFRATGR